MTPPSCACCPRYDHAAAVDIMSPAFRKRPEAHRMPGEKEVRLLTTSHEVSEVSHYFSSGEASHYFSSGEASHYFSSGVTSHYFSSGEASYEVYFSRLRRYSDRLFGFIKAERLPTIFPNNNDPPPLILRDPIHTTSIYILIHTLHQRPSHGRHSVVRAPHPQELSSSA
jgi:hypothetical protein